MEHEKLKVLMVEPQKEPCAVEIPAGLKGLQMAVGGYIEAVYPYEEPVALVCNEEGKLLGLDLNRALRDEDGHIYDVLAGTFLVVGLGDEDFTSLPDDLMEKFEQKFHTPEEFFQVGNRLIVRPMEVRSTIQDKLGEAKRDGGDKPAPTMKKSEPER